MPGRVHRLVALIGFWGILGIATASANSDIPVSNTTFTAADGTQLVGYLAQPMGKGPFPAVIMIHEWWGLTSNIVGMANRLAAQGFVVFAPDGYRGHVAVTPAQAMTLSSPSNFPQIAHDIDAAYQHLVTLPNVDPQRTASLGFCFGGRQSLFLGTRQAALRATVILYGSGLISDASQAGVLGQNGPVLGIFGAEDHSIPQAQRDIFSAIAKTKGVHYTESVFPGVGHAFVKNDTVDAPGAAHDAWEEVVHFLHGALG